jgi:hypothetical protein
MKRNLEQKGRAIRGITAVATAAGAVAGFLLGWPAALVLLLLAVGAFTAFEAAAGWCVLRACGVKTPY